ncbi:cell division control protein 6 [Legionella lansingensis]|uniref:Cell division control protein 6 n=1 Tax=Legionella lansingensis TaxID=45067 RepID=A0A0W0VX58_9GAMM|nr:AAA family ATPase [Legionella lansingensis]KTD24732.1 cell division control protein 6 [Legionella lansingensis]SNV53605.1 cell division control protein 6 [Legionella lansingensis]
MYLDFFNLKEFPFNQCSSTDYYYGFENHQDSMDVLLVGLQVNDGIIKITGDTGTGKSLLCRIFIEKIYKDFYPVYLSNPYITDFELLQAIAAELQISQNDVHQKNTLSKLIHDKALELQKENKKLVLIFDEAQCLSVENLEVIRILSNLEHNNSKLCQIILIGGLELDDKLKSLNHFLQRISFSCKLRPIKQKDLNNYLFHRLTMASKPGKNHGITITPKASKLLYKKTRGIPRLINIVFHKALMLAYSRGENDITKKIISKAIEDTEVINGKSALQKLYILLIKLTMRSARSM